jgi:hypothetical protein
MSMKMTPAFLKRIIKEEIAKVQEAAPPPGPKQKNLHLSQIKELNPKAYKAYLELLEADCQDTFSYSRDGTLRVVVDDPTGYTNMTMVWNPQSGVHSMDPGQGWEEESSDDSDEEFHM